MEIKLPDAWQGNIFCDNAQQFTDHAINVNVQKDGVNHIHQHGASQQVMPGAQAFEQVIYRMVKSGHLSEKGDFGVIYKLDTEIHVMGWKKYVQMADYLERMEHLPSTLQAQACSINSANFGSGIYPHWNIDSNDVQVQSHIHSLAKEYILQMALCGHIHPSYSDLFPTKE